jgi:hypothetical protein
MEPPKIIGKRSWRLSAMTRRKKLEYAQQLEGKFGPDTSETLHEFPDGWSVRRLNDYGDLNREGELMSNCWARSFWADPANMQKYKYAWRGYPEHHAPQGGVLPEQTDYSVPVRDRYYSLRDPDNLPHLSFNVWAGTTRPYSVHGVHNSDPKPEQMEYLKQWQQQQGLPREANILDPIHDTLDPQVWDDPAAAEPKLKDEHSGFIYQLIYEALDRNGYDSIESWMSLVFTGSLTTYQYSDDSDVDVSLFVDVEKFPEWSRAEMIGIMIHQCDGTKLPGTPHVMQCFVVPPGIGKEDLYKPGLRSGYDLSTDTWLVPPDRNRVHDVEKEMNEAYTIALENADKMESLLRYEPDKAVMFWHQIHKRRRRDQLAGKGDYAPSNITYKMLANRGLFPQISDASGEYLAKISQYEQYMNQIADAYHQAPAMDPNAVDAWRELAEDSTRRADEIRNRLNVTVVPDVDDPYPNAKAMNADISRGNFVVSSANSDHPLWTPNENVDFRICHDVLGHHPSGADFSWEGENRACGTHNQHLSPAAQKALFTECIGQTAYANKYGGFGPQKTVLLDHAVPRLGAIGDGSLCHRHIRTLGRTL